MIYQNTVILSVKVLSPSRLHFGKDKA